MSTRDNLVAALAELGLTDMAERARVGRYDDFGEAATPIVDLVRDLQLAAKSHPARDKVLRLADEASRGRFDFTREEAEAWAARQTDPMMVRMLRIFGPLSGVKN